LNRNRLSETPKFADVRRRRAREQADASVFFHRLVQDDRTDPLKLFARRQSAYARAA
jgi:hypothetical protein